MYFNPVDSNIRNPNPNPNPSADPFSQSTFGTINISFMPRRETREWKAHAQQPILSLFPKPEISTESESNDHENSIGIENDEISMNIEFDPDS